MAVIAASGLALGSMPGIANAQTGSEGLLDVNLGLNLGDSVELGVDLGLGSLGIDQADLGEFPDLAGSLGAATGATGSDDLDTGSENLDDDVIGDLIDAGSAGGTGSDTDSDELGSDNGTDTPSGSDSASDELESGSDSASEGSNGDASEGNLSSGSLTPNSGTGSDDDSTDDDSFDFLGSLEEAFGSDDTGSDNGDTGSGSNDEGTNEDEGEDDDDDEAVIVNSTELDAEVLLAVGSLAAAGIAAGIAVNGGINLPPLPAIDAGVVCTLPPEAIDFLKGNGSMQQDECEPEEQN